MAPISSEPSDRPIVRPSIPVSVHPFRWVRWSRPSVHDAVCTLCVAAFLSFVASARSYPSASLRNGNAFCFSFTLRSPEGERARDSFNNPAARSEIYYFRTTLLDKSIWLTLSFPLSLSPSFSLFPFVSLRFTDEQGTFSLFNHSSSFLLHPTPQPRPPDSAASSRTSVQGDLIKCAREPQSQRASFTNGHFATIPYCRGWISMNGDLVSKGRSIGKV